MPTLKIKIKGIEYPAVLTMGAARRFRQKTDKDILGGVDNLTTDDICMLIYCCMEAACNRDGIDISGVKYEDFLDGVEVTRLKEMTEGIGVTIGTTTATDEKKKE